MKENKITKQYYLISNIDKACDGWGVLFWKPEAKGYTGDLNQAGLFDENNASRVATNSHGDTIAVEKEILLKNAKTINLVINVFEIRQLGK